MTTSTLSLGDIYHKNRVLKECLNHLTSRDDTYTDSMLKSSYFHPGGVNYCVLLHKKGHHHR